MSMNFKTSDFIKILSGKGFEAKNRKHGHLGLYLLDEDGNKTSVSTGVSLGGHAREIPIHYIRKIARELHMTPKELGDYRACDTDHPTYLESLRSKGIIRPRGN